MRAGSRRAVLAVASLMLALTGCTSIPTHGGVNAGTVQDPGAANPIGLFPAAPVGDATPTEVVTGFLAAATGQQSDYRVARLFLAPGLSTAWKPLARVLVTDGGTRVKPAAHDAGTVTAAVPVVGRIDAHGAYTPVGTPAASTPLRFHLVKVRGQWRIDRAADGIVLSQPVFKALFGAVTLQFFDPTFRRLYPGRRWFLNRSDDGTAVAEDVVAALLAGPAAPLSGVTASPFPKGTRSEGISLTGTVATVDLAVPGVPSTVVQQRMLAQLRASLRVEAITSVRLSINGVPRSVTPSQPVQPPNPSPQPVGLRGHSFGLLEGSRVVSDVLDRAVGGLKPSAVTISESQGLAAVRTAAGVSVVSRIGQRTAVRLVDRRGDLADPSLDPEGWTYSVPKSQPEALIAFDRSGRGAPVQAAFPAGSRMQSIEVSRDGSRLLVLLDLDGASRSFVAGIVRDGSGRPTRLTAESSPVATGSGAPVDATWLDPGAVATVTQDQEGDQVTIQPLGGEPTSGGQLPGVTDAVGGTNQNDLTLKTQNRALSTVDGSVWVATGVTADVLAVQR